MISWSLRLKLSPSFTNALAIFGFVLTKSFTSGPTISKSSKISSPSNSVILFSKLISALLVKSESSILNSLQILIIKSPSIFLFPPSIKFK